MDTTDSNIRFDENGVCNHCTEYYEKVKQYILPPETARVKLDEIVEEMKSEGSGKEYDCISGISGGMDSSYVAYLAKKFGLRTLLVHLDNGWDSELAVKNIENIVKKTGFDYYNYIVDWEEFKDIQLSYFRASVVDIEVVTDHAITALLYQKAYELDIKYILVGDNYKTEWIMPQEGWTFPDKSFDRSNLLAIHKRFGKVALKTYPILGILKRYYYGVIGGIKTISFLNYLDTGIDDMKRQLEEDFGWRDYGAKHGESVFTKFYQKYILPTKFNIDKRKGHLSNLICSGQITREQALEEIKKELYREDELREEYDYVIKKLGLSREEFEEIMALPIVSHYEYPTDRGKIFYRALTFLMGIKHSFNNIVYKIIDILRIRFVQKLKEN
jgi:N-acetyl sugar amidotransferase